MRVVIAAFVAFQFASLSSLCFAQKVEPRGTKNASIVVSNVKPTGAITGNGNTTVTADVSVTGLTDGTYDVTVVITGYNAAGNTSKQTTGTVTITNGMGTVSLSSAVPKPTASGDTGIVQVEVQDPTSGTSGTGQSNVTIN